MTCTRQKELKVEKLAQNGMEFEIKISRLARSDVKIYQGASRKVHAYTMMKIVLIFSGISIGNLSSHGIMRYGTNVRNLSNVVTLQYSSFFPYSHHILLRNYSYI